MAELVRQDKKQILDKQACAPAQGSQGVVLEDNRNIQRSSRYLPDLRLAAQDSHLSGATGNRSGLPHHLKTGIEALSGMSMDHVNVHYNSDQPAQLNAHAYAQGSDIHLAPGQEKHLPHEAWHVVQQSQGRVNPTAQLSGMGLNDDVALELESDVMGQRALQAGAAATANNAPEQSPPLQRKVIQLVATQITLSGKKKIAQVNIRGRPPRVFSNSMGDHTTAFVVHQEGIVIALQEQSLEDAVKIMSEMTEALKLLPGYSYMNIDSDSAKTGIGQRFLNEYNLATQHLRDAAETGDDELKVHYLQQAINAYLGARELIPFSTINVSEKSQGTAGRGHGESASAGLLSTYERTEDPDISVDSLVMAVTRLFDYQSAGKLASERDPGTASRMAGGISFGKDDKAGTRLTTIWQQHKLSIEKMFPNSWKVVKDQLGDDEIDKVIKRMQRQEFLDMKNQIPGFINRIQNGFANIEYSTDLMYRGNINQTKIKALSKVFEEEGNLTKLLADMRTLNSEASHRFTKMLQETESKVAERVKKTEHLRIKSGNLKTLSKDFSKAIGNQLAKALKKNPSTSEADNSEFEVDSDRIKNIDALKRVQGGSPLENFSKSPVDSEQQPEDKEDERLDGIEPANIGTDVETSTLSSESRSMATQIILNKNGTVAGLHANGRPASPFKDSMGAHSTAWVAHLDRVNRRIQGKTIQAAIEDMQKFAGEVKLFAEKRKTGKLGNKAKELYQPAQEAMDDLTDGSEVSLSHLQSLINAILSFYNLIPDVSRSKIDTGGKGESKHRRTLLNYELYGVGEKEELKEAMNGLYDSTGRSGVMYDNHLTVMKEAYPDSYGYVFDNAKAKARKELPSVQPGDEDDDAEEEFVGKLDSEGVEELKTESANNERWNANNCLINAVTDAAGLPRATVDQVIAIRTAIGARAGEMLFASQRILDRILQQFNLQARGVLVINTGSIYTDQSSNLSNDPLFIYHDGVNHFESMARGQARLRPGRKKTTTSGTRKKKGAAKKREKIDENIEEMKEDDSLNPVRKKIKPSEEGDGEQINLMDLGVDMDEEMGEEASVDMKDENDEEPEMENMSE